MIRSVLITGGAGFIGSNLVRRLLDDGLEVRVLDDLSSGESARIEAFDLELVVGSILDPGLLATAMRGTDAVVHLAALASVPESVADPRRSYEVNVSGTLAVLEEARRGGHQVVFASSSAVFGSNPTTPHDPFDWTRPISPYGASKLAAEGYVNAYRASYGLPTLALRFFNVYGPGQRADHPYAAVIPRFIEAALADVPVEIHGDGLQSRDFIFVDTICDAIADALQRRLSSPNPIHLALGTATTVREIADELERVLGRPIRRDHVESRVGDVRASQSAPGLLQQDFPSVVPVGLSDGLTRTVDWARAVMQ